MMFTPCGPRAVPTGGAGVAAPACSCTLTSAAIFFLGGMGFGSLLGGCFGIQLSGCLPCQQADFGQPDPARPGFARKFSTRLRQEVLDLAYLGSKLPSAHPEVLTG